MVYKAIALSSVNPSYFLTDDGLLAMTITYYL